MAATNPADQGAWHYTADILTPCNCDWGCPCSFNQPPTYGFCQGGWILKIREGSAGGVDLSGLSFAWMGSWPKALHFGGGTGKLMVDERASPEARAAIERLAKGQSGGKPWPVLARTVDHWLPTSFLPFEWKLEGPHSSVTAGTELKTVLTPMRNPVSGAEAEAKIVLPNGILTREENITTTQTFAVFADGIKYAWPGRNAWYATVDHGT